MNWVDGVVIGLLVFSGLLGMLRGFVREVLGVASWAGAGFAALALGPFLIPQMGRLIHDPQWAQIVAYAVIFIIVLIILSVISSAVGQMVRESLLGTLDRTLGGAFGVLRGVALLVIAYMVMSTAIGTQDWPQPVQQAKTLPYIYRATAWSTIHIPQDYRPRLEAPDAKNLSGDEQPLPLAVPMPTNSGNSTIPMPNQAPTAPAGP